MRWWSPTLSESPRPHGGRGAAQARGRRVEDAAIEQAIALLIDQGVLDDARYARLFAHDKRALEQWGSERIRRTLLERGIDPELVEEALCASAEWPGSAGGSGGGFVGGPSGGSGGAFEPESDFDRGLALLRRRFAVAPRDRRERDRALGLMIRKGYDSELALDALAAYARECR